MHGSPWMTLQRPLLRGAAPAAPQPFPGAALVDKAASEADRDCVGTASSLQFREQVADVRLHRFFREKNADRSPGSRARLRSAGAPRSLAGRRLLLEPARDGLQRDDLGGLGDSARGFAARRPRRSGAHGSGSDSGFPCARQRPHGEGHRHSLEPRSPPHRGNLSTPFGVAPTPHPGTTAHRGR